MHIAPMQKDKTRKLYHLRRWKPVCSLENPAVFSFVLVNFGLERDLKFFFFGEDFLVMLHQWPLIMSPRVSKRTKFRNSGVKMWQEFQSSSARVPKDLEIQEGTKRGSLMYSPVLTDFTDKKKSRRKIMTEWVH